MNRINLTNLLEKGVLLREKARLRTVLEYYNMFHFHMIILHDQLDSVS